MYLKYFSSYYRIENGELNNLWMKIWSKIFQLPILKSIISRKIVEIARLFALFKRVIRRYFFLWKPTDQKQKHSPSVFWKAYPSMGSLRNFSFINCRICAYWTTLLEPYFEIGPAPNGDTGAPQDIFLLNKNTLIKPKPRSTGQNRDWNKLGYSGPWLASQG